MAEQPATASPFVTIEEAAAQLTCSPGHVYDLCYRGELASVKIGRSRRVDREHLNWYIEALKREGRRRLHPRVAADVAAKGETRSRREGDT
jgi:excisionase family DNA binding protein